jgi:hypothetical protein
VGPVRDENLRVLEAERVGKAEIIFTARANPALKKQFAGSAVGRTCERCIILKRAATRWFSVSGPSGDIPFSKLSVQRKEPLEVRFDERLDLDGGAILCCQ